MITIKTVLKGKDWNNHLIKNNLGNKKQEKIYVCTHNYTAIYKLDGYYFTFGMLRGYKNLTSLKRLLN